MIALTRALSPRIVECELSFIEREPIDFDRAAAEHEAYEKCLADLGCTVTRIDAAPDHPDGVFVEDAAIVLDDFAIITRSGAESRRGETESVARALQRFRPLRRIDAPATVDGGDVLRIGDTLYVGRSQRTNDAGIAQLGAFVVTGAAASQAAVGGLRARRPSLSRVVPIEFSGCLHLKSAVTQIAPRTLLANREWVDTAQFGDFEVIEVQEPHAANALRIGETIIMGSYPRTADDLRRRGFHVCALDLRELEKAEAGVTCCSLIV